MRMSNELLFWIWFSEALGAASKDFRKLIELYENPYDVFVAEESELERVPELSERAKSRLMDKSLQKASEILESCQRQNIGILTYTDRAYPNILKEIQDPPMLLYYQGKLPDFNRQLCIGMVGTRRMSAYGMNMAYKIAYGLATANAVVVSGMASGIDGVCAAAALSAKGSTVAVLGCGLDVVYPKHHKNLMHAIRENGALLSEYPPSTRPNQYHFPVRNRIISGMCHGTMVVEAGLGSGSLITAQKAVSQGRMVFTVPANVDSPGAEGTNGLLRDGAKTVIDTRDLLEPFRYTHVATLKADELSTLGKITADLKYLDRMGVIELTKRSAEDPQPKVCAGREEEHSASCTKREAKITKRKPVTGRPTEERVTDPPKEDAPKPKAIKSAETTVSLTPIQLAVLEVIPDDRAVSVDVLNGLDFPYGDLIAALTMLEIMELIQKLPGGLYMKA
jgi:DNA processing protein